MLVEDTEDVVVGIVRQGWDSLMAARTHRERRRSCMVDTSLSRGLGGYGALIGHIRVWGSNWSHQGHIGDNDDIGDFCDW